MSQSATSCFVVTFRYQGRRIDRPGEADRAIDAGGFVTSVTDENGVHHELGSNSFAFITVLDQEDGQRLAQGFGQLALGKQPEVAICSCGRLPSAVTY